MPTHAEKRIVPYSAQQMYDLVADIRTYPQFLPWCAGVRKRSEKPTADGSVIEADLVVSFKVYRESFGSRVTLHPGDHKIDVEYLDGPFKYLNNHWYFRQLEDGSGCEIDFFVDFEFRSPLLQAVVGVVFNEAMQRIVRAFETRAEALYGA